MGNQIFGMQRVANGHRLVASEYVSYGHPDKIADQIADAILDEHLRQDENVRAGIEVMVKDSKVVLGGEVNSLATVDHEAVVRRVYGELHFPADHHLAPEEIEVVNLIGKQSEEINSGVDRDGSIGAGDQGFMVGYASSETEVYMPLGHHIAKRICQYVAEREMWGPDTKSQVIVEYDEKGEATAIHSILVSTMHRGELEEVREGVTRAIEDNLVGLEKEIYERFIKDKGVKTDVNPCGSWQTGGPVSDCGITGRKLVVDAYGGYCNIGGGNYSGKDFSKVDRSGAYMARYIAKNIVASGMAETAKVTLAYMIGIAEPCSLEIEMNRNAQKVPEIKEWIAKRLDLTPKGIMEYLEGKRPRFYATSKYGHYGYKGAGPEGRKWEETDLVEEMRRALRLPIGRGNG